MIFKFERPIFLYLLLIIPLLIVIYYTLLRKRNVALPFTDFRWIKKDFIGTIYFEYVKPLLFLSSIAAIIIAIANPQLERKIYEVETEGVDFMLVLDSSTSMLAQDFQPKNRLEVAKNVIADFVKDRKSDRVGLVVFAGKAFTQVPLTIDYEMYNKLLSNVTTNMVEDATAIGLAIGVAVNRLKDSKAKSKVIILATDGDNNAGQLDPIAAAEIAKDLGIKIFTIGVGKKGVAPYPVQTPSGITYIDMEVKINEELLQNIANITGGQYYRATDGDALKKIYKEADKMVKSKVSSKYYTENIDTFQKFLFYALILILLLKILDMTLFFREV